MTTHEDLTCVTDAPVSLCKTPLLALPGEIRNKIYNLTFGTKTTHLLAQNLVFKFTPESEDTLMIEKQTSPHQGLYSLRQTCKQIAQETEHYLYHTIDVSKIVDPDIDRVDQTFSESQQDEFEKRIQNRCQHVRHFIMNSRDTWSVLFWCLFSPKDFSPLAVAKIESLSFPKFRYYDSLLWPLEGRNLTTFTIVDMKEYVAAARNRLVKQILHCFPNLVDVRCEYNRPHPCTSRYRIVDGQSLVWWYSGELFTTLPNEETSSVGRPPRYKVGPSDGIEDQ